MKKILISLLLAFTLIAGAKDYEITEVNPPSWWTQMANSELQIMVHAQNIAKTIPTLDFDGVKIKSHASLDNPNYMFINLEISPKLEKATISIKFMKDGEEKTNLDYVLNSRRENSAKRQGYNSSDVIYLIMPDRFANGDPSNDETNNTKEGLNRKDKNGRHGGDIQGVIDNLDYIADLGATAIWSTPMLEDDCPTYSYHGYAISDYYKIDPRYGTNELYKEYVKKAKQKGLKVIMDFVPNHSGTEYFWMNDLPSQDWINQFPKFTYSNHQKKTALDPYASKIDKKLNFEGWFDTTMADMNLKNPYVLKFFIQNAIWWVEYADLSGIRVDTYPYSEYEPLATWAKSVMTEYPNFNIVVEAWQYESHEIAFWQRNSVNPFNYNSHIPTVMDFPLTHALIKGIKEKSGWDTGIKRVYNVIANDYLYPDPNSIMIFAENHDTYRLMYEMESNRDKVNMVNAFLMTTRGIPQIYYGTEIGMTGDKAKEGDGDIRRDFPGGWAGDKHNAFQSRTKQEAKTYDYMKKLLNWRKSSPVIHTGKMMHYVPNDNIYVYFRYNDTDKVMVVINANDTPKTLKTERFSQMLKGYSTATDVIKNKKLSTLSQLKLKANSALILELK